jgi:hypothetical protein
MKTITLCILTAVILTVSVTAAVEDDLHSLGLFIGTENGYELDRAPTMAEVSVIFVRLLGKEAEAIENNFDHPFNEAPYWVSPYAGYLYASGITDETYASNFSDDYNCPAYNFCEFVLKALGYTREAGDFGSESTGGLVDFEDVTTLWELSEKLGLVSDDLLGRIYGLESLYEHYFGDYHIGGWRNDIIYVDPETGEEIIITAKDAAAIVTEYNELYGLKRSDCVDIINRALNIKIKGTEITLYEKLFGEGN